MQRLIIIPEEELESRDYLSEKFSRTMAWIDLQLIAEEGIVQTSYRALAARWKWSKSATERYIARLVKKGVIGTPGGTKARHSPLSISIIYADEWDKSGTLGGTAKEKAPLFPPCPPPSLSPTPPHTTTPYNPPIIPKEKGYVAEGQNCLFDDAPVPSKKDSNHLTAARFVELWNEGCGQASKILKLTAARTTKINLRIKEFGNTKEEQEKTLKNLLDKIRNSNFLQGFDGKWKISLDWLIANDKNWLKVMEGNYDNRQDYGDTKYLSSAQRIPTKYKQYDESTI